jgi:hypothetical protein
MANVSGTNLKRDTYRSLCYRADGVFDERMHAPFEPFGSKRGGHRDDQRVIVHVDSNSAT